MRKLAFAVTLTVFVIVLSSPVVLAAHRADRMNIFGTAGDSAVVRWSGANNARLVFINERLYPDTYSVAPIDDETATLWLAFSEAAKTAYVPDYFRDMEIAQAGGLDTTWDDTACDV